MRAILSKEPQPVWAELQKQFGIMLLAFESMIKIAKKNNPFKGAFCCPMPQIL